jgi:hypothetical protein
MSGNLLVRFDEGRVGRPALRDRPLSYSTVSARDRSFFHTSAPSYHGLTAEVAARRRWPLGGQLGTVLPGWSPARKECSTPLGPF